MSNEEQLSPPVTKTLLDKYNDALDSNPLLTKSATAALISGAGAAMGSKLTTKRVNWIGVLSFALHGGLVNGPLSHYWFKWLDEHVSEEGISCCKSFPLSPPSSPSLTPLPPSPAPLTHSRRALKVT